MPKHLVRGQSWKASVWGRVGSPAMLADGAHARTDGFVSLSVVASAVLVAVGLDIGDPIVGLIMTAVIVRITWQSFRTVQRDPGTRLDPDDDATTLDHDPDHDHGAHAPGLRD
jgi:divalent metal cation (Fe/Co/Zn/Cd) transporter